MHDEQEKGADRAVNSRDSMLLTYLLATLGFGCLMGWELIGAFSPATALLSYYSFTEAVILRIISVVALLATYFFCGIKANWVYKYHAKFIAVTAILSLAVIINAAISQVFGATPFAVAMIAWVLFGIAECTLAMAWCTFYSLIPTEGTAMSIALGSCLGTAFFVMTVVATPALLSIIATAALVVMSLLFVLFLLTRIPKERLLPVGEFRDTPVFNSTALFSVMAFGIIYGFITVFMCSIGSIAAIIGVASGIAGTLLALLWAYLGNRVDIDNGKVQRISLPIIVCGLLLLPFFDETGKIICGALIITALSHTTIVAWYNSCIESSEFQLHPIKRFANRRWPNWIGFLAGLVLGLVIIPVMSLSGEPFAFVMMALVVIVITAFAIYGANDAQVKKLLDDLLALQLEPESEIDDRRWVSYFKQRCEVVTEQYGLSPRESEVFFLLAKGRNADFIQKELFVSSATVKTHIYHIYQKLDINSQQRLMDMVDAATTSKREVNEVFVESILYEKQP